MNAPHDFRATDAQVDPAAIEALPNSRKVYVQGSRADLRVPMRAISQSDTPVAWGGEANSPVFVYDCAGPYTDPTASIDIRQGLPAMRAAWIAERDDTEVLSDLSSAFGRERAQVVDPAELRGRVSQFGLPKNEFPETAGWPHELYVREGRRLRGDYVLTEHDCLGKTTVEDSVGLGSFIMDSHVVRRIIYQTDKDAHITHLRTSKPEEITAYWNKLNNWQGVYGDLTFTPDQHNGFKDEQVWADENADPHSDALHVVERWTRPDAAHIHVETLIEDPKFYTRPFTYSRTWVAGTPAEHIEEYSCSENNVDRAHLQPGPGPIRPDGTRGYPDLAPLPPPLPRA